MVLFDKTHPDFEFLKLGPKDNKNQPTPPIYRDDPMLSAPAVGIGREASISALPQVTRASGTSFALKAYGSNCGEIKEKGLENLRPKSWHWIKSNINTTLLKERFNALDYSISKDTVRQESLGQQELILLYKSSFGPCL